MVAYNASNPASDGWTAVRAATDLGKGGPAAFGPDPFLYGSGAPSNGVGTDGQYYFRSDTPGTASQRIYVKSAGAWTGIV